MYSPVPYSEIEMSVLHTEPARGSYEHLSN